MMNRRAMLTATAGFFACVSTGALAAELKTHKLALQISDKDPEKMNAVLNVAANVCLLYTSPSPRDS